MREETGPSLRQTCNTLAGNGCLYLLSAIWLFGYARAVEMETAFEVLAEPNRRRILDMLLTGERPVGALVAGMSVSQPAVSKHLRVLRDAGLVESRIDAQRRVYRLRTEPLRELDEWLRPYRERWTAHLDDLERHLDETPEEE
jgi:DNA-binding transcriptional ArsR family regulator